MSGEVGQGSETYSASNMENMCLLKVACLFLGGSCSLLDCRIVVEGW